MLLCTIILQGASPLLLCIEKLRQFFSVLQSIAPVLQTIRTNAGLHKTIPALLCATKNDASTQYNANFTKYFASFTRCNFLFYNIVLQDYSALHSTKPVPLCTTKDMSERMSKDMSEKMLEDMSERMIKDMSENMSEDGFQSVCEVETNRMYFKK